MQITRGSSFREEFRLISGDGSPVFNQDVSIFMLLEYGLDVQKVELPFDGLKAIFDLTPEGTLSIPYSKLFYTLIAAEGTKETKINSGIIEVT